MACFALFVVQLKVCCFLNEVFITEDVLLCSSEDVSLHYEEVSRVRCLCIRRQV